jgi:uncharacterized ferritin-like protein (DUF455 family)
VPWRRITQFALSRIALLDAITHIELNAVDLALGIASRFTKTQLLVVFIMTGLALSMMRHDIF